MNNIKKRIKYLRNEIRNERISYHEIEELKSLRKYIDDNDIELLQWIEEEKIIKYFYSRP